jgi:cytochrome bd-type quinol oxidase subunit 2
MDIIRILIALVMVAIVFSLGTALFHLTKGDSDRKMARALTVRIALSLALFILLMIAWWAGVITPHPMQR